MVSLLVITADLGGIKMVKKVSEEWSSFWFDCKPGYVSPGLSWSRGCSHLALWFPLWFPSQSVLSASSSIQIPSIQMCVHSEETRSEFLELVIFRLNSLAKKSNKSYMTDHSLMRNKVESCIVFFLLNLCFCNNLEVRCNVLWLSKGCVIHMP